MSTRAERDASRKLAQEILRKQDDGPVWSEVRELAGLVIHFAEEVDERIAVNEAIAHEKVLADAERGVLREIAGEERPAEDTKPNRRRAAKRWGVRVSLDRMTLENRDDSEVSALCSVFEAAGAAAVNRARFVDIPSPEYAIPLQSEDWARQQAELLQAAGWSAVAVPLAEEPNKRRDP